MGTYKIRDVLFRNREKNPIRLTETATVGVSAPKGIKCMCRPTAAINAIAKYSAVGWILDSIFLDNSVVGKQTDTGIYVKFEHNGSVYEALCDGNIISWVSPEPEGYAILTPLLMYAISDLYKTDAADELKDYFKEIKETKDKTALLLFCDAFYYGYANLEEYKLFTSYGSSVDRETVKRGLENGIYMDIPLMHGLSKEIITEVKEEPIEEDEHEYMVRYDAWSEDQLKNITLPDALKAYVMTGTTLSVAKKVKYRMERVIERMDAGKIGVDAIGPDYINILMVGRPGTGKTATVDAVSAMTGMPIYTIPFSKHTEEDTVEGKNKVIDGKISFVETEFLKAYEHGGIIVCEEINLADPGVVMGALGQAIEKPFIVMKDGYKPVRRHPLCVIVGTMNTGTAGSKQLNQALSSRFKCTYTLEDPDRNTFINILASKGYNKRTCRYIYDAYDKIMKYLKSPEHSYDELCENITLRSCFGALECMEEGQPAKEAIKNSIIGKIAEVDLEIAKEVFEMVKDSIPELVR